MAKRMVLMKVKTFCRRISMYERPVPLGALFISPLATRWATSASVKPLADGGGGCAPGGVGWAASNTPVAIDTVVAPDFLSSKFNVPGSKLMVPGVNER